MQADQKEQKLTVTATDNEITIKYVVPQVQVSVGGSAVVPAERIAAILRESVDDTVDLEVTEATCQVVGKDSRFRIYGHDPDDFPAVAELTRDGQWKIKAGVLKRMIAQVVFAAARESTRYAINGVLWEQQGKKLRMVATDGRRLARVDGETAGGEKDGEHSAIVPVKALLVVERLLTDPEEKVEVSFTGNQINLCTAVAEISSNLVQGRFPKYADVIPTGCDKKAQVDTEAFRSAVRRAALLTNEQSRGVLLVFAEDELRLTSSTPEAGDAEVTMRVEYRGEKLQIGFNPQYVLEMLRVVEEAEVVCEFSDSSKPGMIRAGKDMIYVIMPVTV
jgi:DNA polymerase-3 subunit beta